MVRLNNGVALIGIGALIMRTTCLWERRR